MDIVDTSVEVRALAAVKILAGLGTVRAAYLFGSHTQGTADAWSDIDVAAFIEGLENWDIRKRAEAMALVMEKVGADVEAHLFPASAHDNPAPATLAQHILRHGTPLAKQQ